MKDFLESIGLIIIGIFCLPLVIVWFMIMFVLCIVLIPLALLIEVVEGERI